MIIKKLKDWAKEDLLYGDKSRRSRLAGVTPSNLNMATKRGYYMIDNEMGDIIIVSPRNIEFYKNLKRGYRLKVKQGQSIPRGHQFGESN